MTAEEQADQIILSLMAYLQKVDSLETEDEKDEVCKRLEEAVKALDAIAFPDRYGLNEDHLYEAARDRQMGWA